MQQLYSASPSVQQLFQSFASMAEPIEEAKTPIDKVTSKLQEMKSTLIACGEDNKAKAINTYMKQLKSTTVDTEKQFEELRKDIKEAFGTEELKNFDNALKNVNKTTQKTSQISSFGKNFRTVLGIGTAVALIRRGASFIKEANQESIDYAETLNLFNVSLGKVADEYGNLDREASKYYIKALAFQEKMEEKLGINIEESMKYQSLFNSMAESTGLSDEYAYIISENTTKLGYDLASLFNIETENAMTKLRAGLAGQTEPLRELGLDITEQSLRPIAEELGITESIRNMTQAEKTILRYIAVLRQAQNAHGDFANTMDSSANQLRVFDAQVTAFKRNIGNLWQNMLGGILPYINAIMMVINELLKMVAELFGFEVWEQASVSTSVGADDLADDLGTASGNAKELKNQLMGFDEINNITLPSSSGGSSGTSVGGIDQRLLEAIEGYDNLMDSVKNKATEIRDKMMEWLGFHRTDDGWKLNEGLTNAEKILDVMKMIGIAIGTWKVSKAVTSIMEKLGIMSKTTAYNIAFGLTLTATGIFAQYKGTQHLLDGDVDIFTLLETFLGTTAGAFGIATLLKGMSTGKHSAITLKNRLQIGFGVMLAFQGIQMSMDGINTDDVRKQIGGLLESAFGGFIIGFGVGGWKIGLSIALVSTVINLTSQTLGEIGNVLEKEKERQYEGLDEIIERNEDLGIPEYVDKLNQQKKAIQDNVNNSLAEIGYTEDLITELESLIDVNGKVTDSYATRVKFILTQLNNAYGTEYELTDNQITKNGSLVTSYKEIKDSIYEIIDAKKAEILLEANEEAYANALKERMTAYQKYAQAQKDLEDFLVTSYENGTNTQSEEYKKRLEQLETNLELSKNAYKKTSKDIIYYEELQKAIIEGNSKAIEEAVSNITNTYEINGETVSATLADQIAEAVEYKNQIIEIFKEEGKEIDEQTKISLNARIKTIAEKLVEQTNTVKELTPEHVEAWKDLATNAEETYNEEISNVEENTRLVLETILGKVDSNSPDFINKWATMAKESSEEYNQALALLPKNTRKKIEEIIGATNSKQGEVNSSFSSLAVGAIAAFAQVSGYDSGSDLVSGIEKGVNDNKWRISNSLTGAAKGAVAAFKLALGINSPSKVMEEQAQFIPEGIAKGIKDKTRLVYNSMKELSEGIRVNSDDFKIDTNQFIDYGQIGGAIETQSNINVSSDIDSRIENAIYRGLSNTTIPVEIEARTDEGIIFTKIQAKAKEFTMQTGEPAFNF